MMKNSESQLNRGLQMVATNVRRRYREGQRFFLEKTKQKSHVYKFINMGHCDPTRLAAITV